MLLIPITGKISWRNPPVATMALIIMNVMIYFSFQTGDTAYYREAHAYYFESGLAAIELPLFTTRDRTGSNPFPVDTTHLSQDELDELYWKMEADKSFQDLVRTDRLLLRNDPEFPEWRELRGHYDTLRSKIVGLNYGFQPAYPSLSAAVIHMFLHGGVFHLLGNMIFLWLTGCLLEMRCGRLFIVLAYVATGLTAVCLYWLLNADSVVPLVGASGAVSGLMGAFSLVFGTTRVKIFYSLGFYFNYLRFPAVLLLPIWIGNECYQLFFNEMDNIAYVAHIGGLLGGGLLGLAVLKLPWMTLNDVDDSETENDIAPILEKALQRIGLLDMDGGRLLLLQILEKYPRNREALSHLFNLEKVDPETTRFHRAAARLLQVLCTDRQYYPQAYDVYTEYAGIASPPRLAAALYVRLASVFVELGHIRTAEAIMLMLLKKRPGQPGLPESTLKLFDAFKRQGNTQKSSFYAKLLQHKYPESPEAKIAVARMNR